MKRLTSVLVLATVIVCLFGFCATRAGAETTWYVDDDAAADFATIQAAIDAASAGDVIIVRDGTYTGTGNRDINFKGKAVRLRSGNGPSKCIIDAEDQGRVFYFHWGETQDTVLEGFTIRNGKVNGDGGGILCSASPTIRNNIIIDKWARDGNGGGIACVGDHRSLKTTRFALTSQMGHT